MKIWACGCVVAGSALFLYCASSGAADTPTAAASSAVVMKLAPPAPPPTGYAVPFARAMDEARAGNYRQAIADMQQSLALAEQQLGAGSGTVAQIAHVAATYQIFDGHADNARPLLERELRIGGRPTTPKDVDLALVQTLAEMGRALEFADPPKPAQATPLLQQSLAINEKMLGRDDPHVGASVFDLASNYALQDKYAQAEPLYRRSLAIFEKNPSAENTIAVLSELGSMYIKQHRYHDAEPLLRRALDLAQKQPETRGSVAAEVRTNLAQLYRKTGRAADADALAPAQPESENRGPD